MAIEGHAMKDDDGAQVIFSEQGTLASHLVCAKLLDRIARLPGYGGQDADACKSYMQVLWPEFEGGRRMLDIQWKTWKLFMKLFHFL